MHGCLLLPPGQECASLEPYRLMCSVLQVKAQGMDATDRAVAIRSLIHSTGREEPEVALNMALKDILRHRRAAA